MLSIILKKIKGITLSTHDVLSYTRRRYLSRRGVTGALMILEDIFYSSYLRIFHEIRY